MGVKNQVFPHFVLTIVQNRFKPELDLTEPVLQRTVVQVQVQRYMTLLVRFGFRFTDKVPKPDLNRTPATLVISVSHHASFTIGGSEHVAASLAVG